MILILHIGLVTNYYMPYAPTALTEYGWSREEGRLSIVWEAPENIRKAKANLESVLSGSRCKTGCATLTCSCKKQGRHCGPGCHCINCSNGTDLPSKRVTDLEVENIVQEHRRWMVTATVTSMDTVTEG